MSTLAGKLARPGKHTCFHHWRCAHHERGACNYSVQRLRKRRPCCDTLSEAIATAAWGRVASGESFQIQRFVFFYLGRPKRAAQVGVRGRFILRPGGSSSGFTIRFASSKTARPPPTWAEGGLEISGRSQRGVIAQEMPWFARGGSKGSYGACCSIQNSCGWSCAGVEGGFHLLDQCVAQNLATELRPEWPSLQPPYSSSARGSWRRRRFFTLQIIVQVEFPYPGHQRSGRFIQTECPVYSSSVGNSRSFAWAQPVRP